MGRQSLFLGNGFNLAIGVNTSYKTLKNSLLKHPTVEKLFTAKGLYSEIDSHPERTEQIIDDICNPYYRAFVMEIFYDKVLQQARGRYEQEKVAKFLMFFGMYFTTNYDPLLYTLLLRIAGVEPTESPFYTRIKEVYSGWVQENEHKGKTYLENFPPKQIFDLSKRLIKKDEGFDTNNMDYVIRVIRSIRGQPFIPINDGFMGSEGEDLVWEDPLDLDTKYDNLFYLHGSTFLYEDNGVIKKRVSDKRRSFITALTEENGPMCVFAVDIDGKKEQIKGNGYLEHCQRRLRNIKGDLCIVGWSCADCDDHLVECINENKNLTKLLIACYGEDDTVMNEKAGHYDDKFKDKERIFWDISTAPFYKEPRKKNTSKK